MKLNRIMRLTIFMLVCLNLSLSAKVFSQAEKFSISKTNATVKEVFEEVMQQTNYHFFYNNEFDVNRKINIEMKNGNIDEVIRKILEGQEYSYKLVDNYIIIKREAKPALPQSKHVRRISGIVKDADGTPLPGVTVIQAGTTLGVSTDIDGKFKFVVPGPGAVLRFSFIGKKTYEVVVEDEDYFDVTLEDDKEVLDEVVCTGIQTISRERATGSFEIINSDALNKTLTSDVVSRLSGKIAGVQIDQNAQMTIRGRGSLESNTSPLIVVDGFPIESDLNSVNPDDIASITVLKDAAAASIWGVRAANGVIVITTKNGKKEEKPSLDISYFLTINSKDDYKDLHLLSPEQAIDLQLEQIQKGWWNPTYVDQYHSAVNKVQEAYYNAMKRSGQSDIASINAWDAQFGYEISELRKADLYKQFERELLQRAVTNRLNVAFRGGSERNNYYLSAVYEHEAAGEVGNQHDDLLVNLKNDYQITNRLSFYAGVNVHYNKTEDNGIDITRLAEEAPYHNLLDRNGDRIRYYLVDPWEGKNREAMGYLPYTTNMLDEQEDNDNTTDNFSARLQAALKLDLAEGLNIETRFQYERAYTKTEELASEGSTEMRQLINDNTVIKDGQLINNFPIGGRYSSSKSELEAWTWRNQLTYNGEWNDSRHLLTAVLGHEMRMYRTMGHSNILYGYDSQALTHVPIDEEAWHNQSFPTWYGLYSSIPTLNSSYETDNRDLSVYLNAAYTFNNRYSVSASGRVDQSNLFGNDSDYKYNFIWSTGLSWRISEEEFAQKDWIDLLTLRFTYGIGGNVNKNFYPMLMGEQYISNSGIPVITLTNPANKDLTWEKSTTFNAGLDYAFLGHRISGSLDYYHKKGTDLLGRVSLDPTNGFPEAKMNFASVLNQGFEFTLNTVPLDVHGFTWDLGFNISYNKNKVTKIETDGTSDIDYLEMSPAFGGNGAAIVGKPLARLYSYRYAGLNENGLPLLWENGKKVNYADFNRIPENLKYEGTTEAPWYGGVNTALTYKGITLSANATYKFGHKFRLPVGYPGSENNGNEDIADRWQEDHTDTNVPGLLDYTQNNAQMEISRFYSASDINVRDAAYLRLNEISLSYILPRNFIAKTPFENINVQFQVRNLALWTANKEHVDPEAVLSGTSFDSSYTLPQSRSFILGVKLTF